MVVKKIKDVMIQMPSGEMITFQQAIDYCEEWWKKYVETGVSPEFDEVKDKEYLDIIRTSKPINDTSLESLCDSAKELVDNIEKLKDSTGITSMEKELKTIEASIKQGLMDSLKDGETKATCKQYKLSGTTTMKFNEKLFAEKHPNTYDKFLEPSLTYRLSKIKMEEE